MFVIVKASNPGRDGRWRAGRFFPNGAQVKLEVVPNDRVGTLPKDAQIAHAPFVDGKPSMTHISQAGYESLVADKMLSKTSDEATAGSLANAAFDKVKRQNADLASELAEARATIAKMQAEIDSLKGDGGKGKGKKGDKE